VIKDPPLEAGAVHDTTAREFPGVAFTPVGAAGGVDGSEAVTAVSSITKLVWSEPFSTPVKESEIVWPA